VLDIAGINAYIVYNEVTGKKITHHFLLKLIENLQMKHSEEECAGASCDEFDVEHLPEESVKTKRKLCKIECIREK